MNEARQRLKLWDLPVMDSLVKSPDVTLSEMIFGYFLGPFLVLAMTTVISTYYLTFYRTYDDIFSSASSFLVLLPLISVIPMALANIIVGVILGRTQTRQGKARPLLFTAAPLLLSGMVMFLIPYLSLGFRLAWMAITYNIFAAVANPVYSNAHSLMVSLSTRNLEQRGKLSVIGSVICLLSPGNIWILLIGQVVKGLSSIPGAYIMMALFADVLDHLEARFGYRVDGVSMSVYSTILTVVNGLAIAFFNLFYDGGVFAARSVASFFFLGFEIPAQIVLAVILLFLTVEKGIKEDQRIIAERKAVQQ